MPPPGAIRAGRAFVELFADDSKLVRGLRRAQARLNAFGAAVTGIGLGMMAAGAAIVAPLVGAAKTFADLGSQLWDMSQRTGVSVEALSELSYAAEQTGAGIESLEKGLRKMQKSIYDAERGLTTAKDAFKVLGLSVKDLKGLAPERQFRLIADRLDKVTDPGRKAAVAMDLFGRAGTQLLPMIRGGAAALDKFTDDARRLGLVMSTQDAEAADKLGDAWVDLRKTLRFAAAAIGGALAPVLGEVLGRLISATVKARQWIDAHRQMIVVALKLGAATVVAGAGLVALGAAMKGVAGAIGLITAGMAGLRAVLGALFTVRGAILGVAATVLWASGRGGQALKWLGAGFGGLSAAARRAWDEVRHALETGDIRLAAEILWTELEGAWQAGISALRIAWIDWQGAFQSAATEAFVNIIKAWNVTATALANAWAELRLAWQEMTTDLGRDFAAVWYLLTHPKATTAEVEEFLKALQDQVELMKEIQAEPIRREITARTEAAEEFRRQLDEQLRLQQEIEAARRGGDIAAIKARQAELDKKRQELATQRLITQAARDALAATESWLGPQAEKVAERLRGGVQAALGGVADRIAGVGVAGTFDAAAIRSLQTLQGTALERVAEATEETARNTQPLRDSEGAIFM